MTKHYPELPAYLVGDYRDGNLWKAWCGHCGRWHTHGAGRKGEDPMAFLGHRTAHCDDDAPVGYVLVYGGRWRDLTPEQRRYGPDGKRLQRERRLARLAVG